MKQIGTTPGGVLVELTQEEALAFLMLAKACEGDTWLHNIGSRGEIPPHDFKNTFDAIAEFIDLRAWANSFDMMLKRIQEKLGPVLPKLCGSRKVYTQGNEAREVSCSLTRDHEGPCNVPNPFSEQSPPEPTFKRYL